MFAKVAGVYAPSGERICVTAYCHSESDIDALTIECIYSPLHCTGDVTCAACM